MPGGFCPDLVRYRVRPVEPGDGLGERQRGAFGIGEVRRIPPGRQRAVAYRMLGSLTEADDAVQEAWLRLSRSDTSGVEISRHG